MDERDPFLVLPDPYLRAIGLICVEWTGLERLLNLLVVKLLGISEFDPRGMIATEHMTFPLKMNIFKSLIHELQGAYPHLSAAPPLYERIEEAQRRRNVVLHGTWTYDTRDGLAVLGRAAARGRLKTSIDRIKHKQLEQDADYIRETTQLLWKAVIETAPPSSRWPSPDKS